MLSLSFLKQILKKNQILSESEFKKIQTQAVNQSLTLEQSLFAKKIISEESLYKLAANEWKKPYLNLRELTIDQDVLNLIPQPIAQTHKIIAFEKTERELKVALVNPKDLEIIEFLEKQTGRKILMFVTTPTAINEAFKRYRRDIAKQIEEAKPLEPAEQPVVKIVESLFENAILEEASDIHLEPIEKYLRVRYRLDGMLKEVMTFPKSLEAGIVSRIKVLATLKIDEHRLPQDGRFKIANGHEVTVRTAVVPSLYGEKIAMRLLNEKAQALSLEDLGFHPRHLEIMKANIEKPKGLILVTGPTGSGKSTTLYSVIKLIQRPEINIMTVEDPIEYTIPRITQSQINPKIGYTFATGLRAFLRQDPNVIMVGEIRDDETAQIAVHAGLTGHLVLSTLHTNDAVTAIPRLIQMNVPSYLVASTVNIVLAQRLVRKICRDCKIKIKLTPQTIEQIAKNFDVQNIVGFLKKEKLIKTADLEKITFYKGTGCKTCHGLGYKGRTGIYEILEVSDELSELILKSAPSQELQKAAASGGMMTMLQDGLIKAVKGITSIEEIIRTTHEY